MYSTVRNQFGSAGGPPGSPTASPTSTPSTIIRIEEAVGLYFEQSSRSGTSTCPADGWIGFWNVFYGTAHFLVTAVP